MEAVDQGAVDEAGERWTPDAVTFRDATREGGARRHAEKVLARFVDDVRALGFEELGFVGARFENQLECVPDPTAGELRELEADAADEVEGAADRLAYARELRTLHDMWERDHLVWAWSHPGSGDVAYLERNGDGDWLSFSRLHADGSIVRTARRPDGYALGAPGATGIFVDAPLPGLYALMCRLAGDQFRLGKGPKPRIRQWDHTVDDGSAEDVFAAHRRHADAVGVAATVVRPDMALVLATNRRTMHVTLAGLERAQSMARRAWGAIAIVGRLVVAGIVAFATGEPVTSIASAILLPWAGGAWWSVACGASAPTGVLLPTALVLYWAWRVQLAPAWLAVAFAVALTTTVAGRLAFLWLGQAGRMRFDAGIDAPPLLPPAELLRVYRD